MHTYELAAGGNQSRRLAKRMRIATTITGAQCSIAASAAAAARAHTHTRTVKR